MVGEALRAALFGEQGHWEVHSLVGEALGSALCGGRLCGERGHWELHSVVSEGTGSCTLW